jgi:prepilin-type N-terminal cleavage/methylation domain-containing protein/prepilin-type processing-associated H-X9-DG protein
MLPRRSQPVLRRYGFSLIELLIVTAIVGVLATLLMPAVQAAREASRRASCQCHLRQVGLALLNYESANREFPIGAKHSVAATHGISWWIGILPFLEESSIYDRFDMDAPQNGYVLMHPKNGHLVDGLVIDSLICPSTPLSTIYPVGSFQLMMPSYVGIAGAANDSNFREQRVSQCCVPLNNGEISSGGILIPNRAINSKQIIDGVSKTMMVGETSDYGIDASGTPMRIDAAFLYGWILGTTVDGVPPNYSQPYPAWNITTNRYAPNERHYNLLGIHQNRGPNNPLVSPHPGGVDTLFADGSMHFLTDGLDVRTLKMLSTRDDGETAQQAF